MLVVAQDGSGGRNELSLFTVQSNKNMLVFQIARMA